MTEPTDTTPLGAFGFDNTYARELEGFFVPWKAAEPTAPEMVLFNRDLAAELGFEVNALAGARGAQVFSGKEVPEGAEPLAQVYAGHQFGGFTPQLGDGRALLLGEVVNSSGERLDVQLKGSGATPFSRGGDGKAGLGPVLREYLIAEAMHALGVPTTRALAAVTTGDTVYREQPSAGAVLTRVASSHIRVGTFQYFAARGEEERVLKLAQYTLRRHFPESADAENPYLELLSAIADRQAYLVARWMNLGFIHGVMNTDNMAVSGETIDYGPCAFMDRYDPATVFSSIDHGGRYAFGNQPGIANWNLARLAETLLPGIEESPERAVELATVVIEGFAARYSKYWLQEVRAKLGLRTEEEGDGDLAMEFLEAMTAGAADYTLAFRFLAESAAGRDERLLDLWSEPEALKPWLNAWRSRLEREPDAGSNEGAAGPELRAEEMRAVNPIYIPRNHKVEEALDEAVRTGELELVKALLEVTTSPYVERPDWAAYAEPAAEDSPPYRTFCGT